MRQEITDNDVKLYFGDDPVFERDDRSHPGLIIGYGRNHEIVQLILTHPKKRTGSDEVLVVERYDPVADAVDIELDEGAWIETEESPLGFFIDFDSDRRIVALEFLGASRRFPKDALALLNHAA
jgi:uncharacterized protein YuzE